MRKYLLISAAVLLLPMAAMAQTGSVAAGSAATHLNAEDQHFINTAAAAGLSEVQEGRMAQSKGGPEVQKIGARMVADHTKANQQLTSLAQSKGATVPDSVTNLQAAQAAHLQETSGSSFDRLYLRDQKRAHEQAISLFETEAQNGKDPNLKNFAATTLPTLKEHLHMIEAAQTGAQT